MALHLIKLCVGADSIEDLREKYPQTRWRNDRRYVFDDKVVTTSGVSARSPAPPSTSP